MKRKGRPSCIYTGVVGQERKSVWSFCGVLFLGGLERWDPQLLSWLSTEGEVVPLCLL